MLLGPLSFEQTRLVSEMCNAILMSDTKIAFVSVLSRHGRLVDSHCRAPSPFDILTQNEREQIFMQRVLQTRLINDFDGKLGKLGITIIQRESFTECIIPFYDGAMLVVVYGSNQVLETTKKITKTIKDFFEVATTIIPC